MDKTKSKIDGFVKKLKKIDTQKINRSAALLALQKDAAELQQLLSLAEDCEREMLSLLTSVRNQVGPDTALEPTPTAP